MPDLQTLLISAGAVALFGAGSAVAQHAPATSTERVDAVETVVVTARKREESLQEVPLTVNAFTADNLAQMHANSIQDVTTSVSNINFSSRRASNNDVTIRGFGRGGVGLYVDGAYQPSNVSFSLPLFDVERIEFAKGPQGTLYGRNSFAGAINVITRAPSSTPEASVSLEVGSGSTVIAGGSVAGPLWGDVLSGRLTVGVQRRDGFFDYTDGADADPTDIDSASARLLLTPTDEFSADLKLRYLKRRGATYSMHQVMHINDLNGPMLMTPVFTSGVHAGRRQFDNTDDKGATLKLRYDVGGAELISLSDYTDLYNTVLYDLDFGTDDLYHTENPSGLKLFSEELRLQSTGDGPFTWLVGAYYTEGKTPVTRTVSGGTRIPNGVVAVNRETRTSGYSMFTDLEYALTDHISIGAGARYDRIESAVTGTALKATFDGLQPKLMAKYRFDEGTQVYVTSAKGFRQGGFNAAVVGTPQAVYPNDELWSHELGFKTALANGRGTVDVALFYMKADSFTGTAAVYVPAINEIRNITVPIGEIESYGIELTSQFALTDRLQLELAGGYNIAEPIRLLGTVARGSAAVGKQMVNTPLWTYNVGARYDVPLTQDVDMGLRLAVSGSGPTNKAGDSAIGLLEERDPYFLVDTSVDFQWRRYVTSLFVKNATDERYANEFSPVSTVRLNGATTSGVIYNNPRYYGVSFRASF